MSSVYVIELLTKKDGESQTPPEFYYRLSGEWATTADLAKVLAFDGAERFKESAETSAADIAEACGQKTRVRRIDLKLTAG